MNWFKDDPNRVAIGRLYASAAEYRDENLHSAIAAGRVLIDGRPLRKKETELLLEALDAPAASSFGVVVVPGQAPAFGFKL